MPTGSDNSLTADELTILVSLNNRVAKGAKLGPLLASVSSIVAKVKDLMGGENKEKCLFVAYGIVINTVSATGIRQPEIWNLGFQAQSDTHYLIAEKSARELCEESYFKLAVQVVEYTSSLPGEKRQSNGTCELVAKWADMVPECLDGESQVITGESLRETIEQHAVPPYRPEMVILPQGG